MFVFAMLREPFDAVSHGLGAVVATVATIYLWIHAGRRPGSRVSCLIYGICLTFCLASSAALHGAVVSEPVLDVLLKLDHIGIFLLIAGLRHRPPGSPCGCTTY